MEAREEHKRLRQPWSLGPDYLKRDSVMDIPKPLDLTQVATGLSDWFAAVEPTTGSGGPGLDPGSAISSCVSLSQPPKY